MPESRQKAGSQMFSRQAAVAIPEIVPKEAWELEFGLKHTIPSSTRTEPAKALLLFAELLKLGRPMKVLDAGCGNGRNSVFLGKRGCDVTAVDFADLPLSETRRRVAEAGISQSVSVVRGSLIDPLPFADEMFDFVLDSYVSCHFLHHTVAERFWREINRVTSKNGHVLSVGFSTEDEYYARLRNDNQDFVVCDPANGIWKRLYCERELKEFFARVFGMEYFAKFEFWDCVLGHDYRRVVFTSVLKKISS
jgi:ubiquinone/menaquinone biosynthesis C-methylase UbiE